MFLKRINKLNLRNKLIPYCYISVPFVYKAQKKVKILVSFMVMDGFFEFYIFGFLHKINLQGFILYKELNNIKYNFIYLMPFLLIYVFI